VHVIVRVGVIGTHKQLLSEKIEALEAELKEVEDREKSMRQLRDDIVSTYVMTMLDLCSMYSDVITFKRRQHIHIRIILSILVAEHTHMYMMNTSTHAV
jgi:hypothetical protein